MKSVELLTSLLLLWQSVDCKVWRYNLTVSSVWSRQDGHGRPQYALNGQSPGPLLTVREGEEMEVFVNNQLAIETTLHWHGIYQVDRPWNDGVPGVTQFSIQPRDNYTQRFTVQSQYGSYFYHGHFGPAFADGMRGPVWVIPGAWRKRPYDQISQSAKDIAAMRMAEETPRHIIVSDWNAEPMDILLVQYRDTGFAPWCSNSLTLNNRGRTYCHSASVIRDAGGLHRNSLGCLFESPAYKFTNPIECEATQADLEVVQAEIGEEWIWINFIHSGAHHEMAVSIDEHDFYVVAADGEFVYPQKVKRANINLGERISVLVKLDQKPGDYAIRLSSLRREQVIEGLGILRYNGYEKPAGEMSGRVPKSKPWVHLNGTMIAPEHKVMDERKLRPFPSRPPPRSSDSTLRFVQLPPLLWNDASRGDTSYGANATLKNGTVVDIIFENDQGVETQHPFHKHNHKAWIIGQGFGGFPFETVDDALGGGYSKFFNLIDPPIRDGCRLESGNGAWTVIRYQITFPAASMLHCHMIHHFASGQQVILLEGLESMARIPEAVRHRVHSDFIPPIRYGPLE